jgi:hypothetical protein
LGEALYMGQVLVVNVSIGFSQDFSSREKPFETVLVLRNALIYEWIIWLSLADRILLEHSLKLKLDPSGVTRLSWTWKFTRHSRKNSWTTNDRDMSDGYNLCFYYLSRYLKWSQLNKKLCVFGKFYDHLRTHIRGFALI